MSDTTRCMFDDGPAAGKCLKLGRAPVFLRVVRAPNGAIDALDQLTDLPQPDETMSVYILAEEPTLAFVDGVDPKTKRRCGWRERLARYTVLNEEVPDATLRHSGRWQEWTRANSERLCPPWAKGKLVDPRPPEGGSP